MASPRIAHFGLLAAWLFSSPLLAQPPRASESRSRNGSESTPFRTKSASSFAASQLIPFDALSPALREKVRRVVQQPTLVTNAPEEEIPATPKSYEWLLDHPDRAALAWQRLGVDCAPITDRGNGRFGWSDDQGSDLVWSTIANGANARIWYCDGHVRPGHLLPLIPVQAVVVLRHTYDDAKKNPRVRHQVDIFAHADSRAANIIARLFGNATDRMAEQGSEQLLTFFGSLSKHVTEHPDRADKLLAPPRTVRAANSDGTPRATKP